MFTVWNHDQFFDIASCTSRYNLLLLKKHTYYHRRKIKIGDLTFIPGIAYTKIGNGKKSSSGFTFYDGEPLIYQGIYNGYLLFTKKLMPDAYQMGYVALFYTFAIVPKHDCLLTLNPQNCPRLINLN